MATSINIPALSNSIRSDVPNINVVIKALAKNDPSVLTDLESGTKRIVESSSGWEIQQYNGTSWVTLPKFNIDAQKVDGFDASASVLANTIPVRNADGAIPGNITGTADTANKLSDTLAVDAGGTGATTPADARTNLGVPPTSHASTTSTYGASTSTNYGHTKLSDAIDSVSDASTGIAATPKALSTGLDGLMDDVITAATNAVAGNTAIVQQLSTRVDEIVTNKADKFVNNKGIVRSVNGFNADSDGNVNVGGLPLGSLMPYTGKDVPSGFLRADGSTYTNMREVFPAFYEWVADSGLTVPLANYTLVEGSCGFYGIDETTGTVRMPTLAAGVFGTTVAGQYGKAVEAGLPGHTHTRGTMNITGDYLAGAPGWYKNDYHGALYLKDEDVANSSPQDANGARVLFDASRAWTGETSQPTNDIYSKSDTVTPSHVKYPWVIAVYNAAVPPSVAQAGEFVELLDGKADKTQLTEKAGVNAENFTAEGRSLLAGLGMPSGRYIDLTLGASGATYTAPANGYYVLDIPTTANTAQVWAGGNYWFDGRAATSGYIQWTSPACKKGDMMSLYFNSVNTGAASFRFIYAEGDA